MIRRMLIVFAALGLLTACGGGSKSTEGDQKVAEQSMEESAETESEAAEESEPAETPESTAQMKGAGMGPMMDMCPMHVEGTTMALEDTEKGVAMVFTNAESTEEVRDRAMQMADHHAMAMDHHGSPLPAFEMKTEKTDTGARVMMMPKDTSQMQAFKTAVHERHDAQGDQKCPMMMMYNPKRGPHGPKGKGKGQGMNRPDGS